eukprot:Awhi_evm1s14201
MTYSMDMKWRAIVLYEIYSWTKGLVQKALGCNQRSLRRWLKQYREYGTLVSTTRKVKNKWPLDVIKFVEEYAVENPTFYLEEIQDAICSQYPTLKNVSISTVCRVITQDLKLTRKVISKRAYEARIEDLKHYEVELNDC